MEDEKDIDIIMDEPDEQETQETDDTAEIMKRPEIIAAINKAVQDGIKEALKGKTPQRNTSDPLATERAEFKKMGYKERLKLFNADPTKYNKLVGGN